ncbi:hypothetical protein [Periweissella cryptocerci]|nr:hypothetical protein [Periweissella cryptocerci]
MNKFTDTTIAGWALLLVTLVLWGLGTMYLKKEEQHNGKRSKQTSKE